MDTHFSCDSFAGIEWSDYVAALQQSIREEIFGQKKDYILGIDENDYRAYLVNKYTLHPLEIFEDSERVIPRTQKETVRGEFGNLREREV